MPTSKGNDLFLQSRRLPRTTYKDTKYVPTFKPLGIVTSADLTWGPHVDYLHGECVPRLYLLAILKRAAVSAEDMVKIYNAMNRSVLEYACQVWHTSLTTQQSDKVEPVRRRELRIIHRDRRNVGRRGSVGSVRNVQARDREFDPRLP